MTAPFSQRLCEGLAVLGHAARGNIQCMLISEITDEFAFSFGPTGWNYLRALAQSHDDTNDRERRYAQFEMFFQHAIINAVRHLEDLLFLHVPDTRAALGDGGHYLGTYPWGGLTRHDTRNGGVPFGWFYDEQEQADTRELWGYGSNLWYRPSDAYTIAAERDRSRCQKADLQNGFHPWRRLSFPTVARLERSDGAYRGVVVDGHHRMACLGLMGYRDVPVIVTEIVREADIDDWYYVKRGRCSRDRALAVFNAFFELDGSERFAALELPK
jgi:hypothetical protein